jgi:diguanylate cyclase (GGDEF)-like protein/PAS domain S-box-containing protein
LTLRLIPNEPDNAPARHAQASSLPDEDFRELFDSAGALLAILDAEGRFIAVSAACERVLGHEPQALVGRSLLDFVSAQDAKASVAGTRDSYFELLAHHRHADGSWRWLRWSGSTRGERWFAAARDVTEWISLEDRVGRDPLTHLPNCEVFTGEVNAALGRHAAANGRRGLLSADQHLGVLFVDVDGLKQINDGIGHDAGDRLIAQVAERLRAAVRGEDLVARIGGDEFGVLVEQLDSAREAGVLAQRILTSLEAPLDLGSGPMTISASIGVALAGAETTSAEALIHEADVAMYKAKSEGRRRHLIFDSVMRAEMQLRADVERDLHQALSRDELVLHYQPIVSLADGRIVGAEALLRWAHPTRGTLHPGDFLALAEQTGLILPIGRWTLQTAARQASAWGLLDWPNVAVSVNLSPRQLADEELVASVRSALEVSGLAANRLCVEVGEAAALADPVRAASRLTELRELGIGIAFDAFGSGYSPLRALLQLPIDTIKLDKSFVADYCAGTDQTTRAILLATVAAARELGMQVIACGVEDPAQLDALREAGCDCAQGNGIAPPDRQG